MTSFVQVNFFTTTISAALTTSDTSLSLGSTTGAPSIPSGSVWPLILTANDIYEVVYVTALSGSTATIERAQEGTTAQAWASGTTIYGAFTAGAVLYDGDSMTADDLTVTGTATLQGTLAVAGDTSLAGTSAASLNVAGTAVIEGNVTLDGTTTAATLAVTDDATVGGTLGVTGATTIDAGLTLNAPSSGTTLTVDGQGTAYSLQINSAAGATIAIGDLYIARDGSTANAVGKGPCLQLQDTSNTSAAMFQLSGDQIEIWQEFANGGGWSQRAYWNSAGGLNLNAASSGYTLTVNGSVYAQSYNNPSDERLKSDIRPIDSAMARARQIRGVFFKWKSDNSQSAGVLAQEVQAVFPEAVRVHANGTLCVDQMALIGLLFAALGETEDQR